MLEGGNQMKKTILAMILLAGSALAGPRISFGIGFGAPAPVMVRPVCPGAGYAWVNGYYAPDAVWVPGFWRRPAVNVFVGPRRVGRGFGGPRFAEPRYYAYYHGREFHRDYRR